MKFLSVEMLFLIWAAPAVLIVFIYGMRRRSAILSKFSTPRGLAAIAGESEKGRRRVKIILLLLVVLFTALALSGPQYGYKWEEVEQRGVDLFLALDCSKSMLAKDIPPSRLDRAKREILDLLGLLRGDRIGLVAFAGTAFVQCPLTLDYGAFHVFLDVLSPDYLPVQGTDIPGAIRTALASFSTKENTEKAIILITDGESTTGDALDAADEALAAGVKLFCIGVGGREGAPVPGENGGFKKDAAGNIILTRLDEETLKQMAVETGGTYVRSVAGNMDLDVLYTEHIRGAMKAEMLSAGKRQIWENRYQWALAVALIAFCLELFIPAVKPRVLALVPLFFLMTALFGQPARAENTYEKMQTGAKAYEAKKYDKALDKFIGAQLEEPDRPEISYNLGNAYYKLGDFEAAEKHFAQTLSTESDSLKEKALYNLGNTFFRRQKLDKAVENYNAALKIDPNDKEAAANLELAKKLLEQQQKQESQSDDKNKEQEQKKDKMQEGEGGEKQKSDKKEETGESSQDGKGQGENSRAASGKDEKDKDRMTGSKDESEKKEGDEEKLAQPDDKNETGQDQEKKGGASDNGEQTDQKAGQIGKQQAESMLNRLEDKPGRALIPAYGKREVEKDW